MRQQRSGGGIRGHECRLVEFFIYIFLRIRISPWIDSPRTAEAVRGYPQVGLSQPRLLAWLVLRLVFLLHPPSSSHQLLPPTYVLKDVQGRRWFLNSPISSPLSTPASMSGALTSIDLPELQLLNRGKVRDVYATSDPTALLFVASDRISAYDVILNNVRCCSSFPSETCRPG